MWGLEFSLLSLVLLSTLSAQFLFLYPLISSLLSFLLILLLQVYKCMSFCLTIFFKWCFWKYNCVQHLVIYINYNFNIIKALHHLKLLNKNTVGNLEERDKWQLKYFLEGYLHLILFWCDDVNNNKYNHQNISKRVSVFSINVIIMFLFFFHVGDVYTLQYCQWKWISQGSCNATTISWGRGWIKLILQQVFAE